MLDSHFSLSVLQGLPGEKGATGFTENVDLAASFKALQVPF